MVGSQPVPEDSDEDEGPETPPPWIEFGEGWEAAVNRYESRVGGPFPVPRRPVPVRRVDDDLPHLGPVPTSADSDRSNPFDPWSDSSETSGPGSSSDDVSPFGEFPLPKPGGLGEVSSEEVSPFDDVPLPKPGGLGGVLSEEVSPFDDVPVPEPGGLVLVSPAAPPLEVVVDSLLARVPTSKLGALGATGNPERVRDSAERIVALGDEWIVDEGPDLFARSRDILRSLEQMGVTIATRRVLGRIADQYRPWASDRADQVSSHHWCYQELEALLAVMSMLRKHSPTPGEVAAQRVGRVDGESLGTGTEGGVRFGNDVLLSGPAIRRDDSRQRFMIDATRQLGEPYLRSALEVPRPLFDKYADLERFKEGFDGWEKFDGEMLGVARLLVDGLMSPAPAEHLGDRAMEFIASLSTGEVAKSLRATRHDIASPISPPGGRASVVQLGRRNEWVVVTRRSDVPRAVAVVDMIEGRYNVTLDSLSSMRSSRAEIGRKRRGKYRALPWFVSELEAVESALRRYALLIGRARTSTTARRRDGTDWRLGKVDEATLVRPRTNTDRSIFSGATIYKTRTILLSGHGHSAIDSRCLERTMVHELAHALVQPDVLSSFMDDLGFWTSLKQRNYGPTNLGEGPPSEYGHTSAQEDLAETFEDFLTASDTLEDRHWHRFVWCVREVRGWR